jgi:hypothetical protein
MRAGRRRKNTDARADYPQDVAPGLRGKAASAVRGHGIPECARCALEIATLVCLRCGISCGNGRSCCSSYGQVWVLEQRWREARRRLGRGTTAQVCVSGLSSTQTGCAA